VFESVVDRLGGAAGCGGPVEEREEVVCPIVPIVQGSAQASQFDERGRDAGPQGLDERCEVGARSGPAGVTVRGDHPRVDAPGDLHLGVGIEGDC